MLRTPLTNGKLRLYSNPHHTAANCHQSSTPFSLGRVRFLKCRTERSLPTSLLAATWNDLAPPAFADFGDDSDEIAFTRSLNSLRRGLIMLVLRLHNAFATQQAFLLLQALTHVPAEVTLSILPASLEAADTAANGPPGVSSSNPGAEQTGSSSITTAVLDCLKQVPKSGSLMDSVQEGWFHTRLVLLTLATAMAFMLAGLTCVLLSMPPQHTSLAVEPSRVMLGRYVEYLQLALQKQQPVYP